MMNTPETHWRPMAVGDLAAVEAIAAIVHPGFFERPEIFAERLRLYPQGARLLTHGPTALGYVLSHPWRDEAIPALDSLLRELPAGAKNYYLHDLALLPEARGTGAAGRLVADLIAHATTAGFSRMSLVAVNGSQAFWRRHGFSALDVPDLRQKLSSYEADAAFMVRPLA
jgi:GNAT superfamily N-acetyltransferase